MKWKLYIAFKTRFTLNNAQFDLQTAQFKKKLAIMLITYYNRRFSRELPSNVIDSALLKRISLYHHQDYQIYHNTLGEKQ